jgi:hypothetical protein
MSASTGFVIKVRGGLSLTKGSEGRIIRTMGPIGSEAGGRRRLPRPAIWVVSGVVVILVAVAGWFGVATWLGSGTVSAQPRSGNWRTEQFRDITFRVPVEWGYAYEPGADWCAGVDHESPTPKPEHQRPYVALGSQPWGLDLYCPDLPDTMLTEHVTARPAAEPQGADGRSRLGRGFWEIIRTVGTVKLRVISQDADLAREIADSAAPAGADAPCRPFIDKPGERVARPDPAFDVAALEAVRSIVLCQYNSSPGFGLSAATELDEPAARRLIDAIGASPKDKSAACPPDPEPIWYEVAVLLHVRTETGLHTLNLYLHGCRLGGNQVRGGIDDGTTVRRVTRETCQAVITPPLRLDVGSGTIYALCGP